MTNFSFALLASLCYLHLSEKNFFRGKRKAREVHRKTCGNSRIFRTRLRALALLPSSRAHVSLTRNAHSAENSFIFKDFSRFGLKISREKNFCSDVVRRFSSVPRPLRNGKVASFPRNRKEEFSQFSPHREAVKIFLGKILFVLVESFGKIAQSLSR